MNKSILIVFVSFVMLINVNGQDTLVLSESDVGYQTYVASSRVHFLPGYSYKPNGSESMKTFISSLWLWSDGKTKYNKLEDELDGGYYIYPGNFIFFKYVEKYRPGNLDFKIYEFKDQVLISSSSTTVSKVYGDNWIKIGICQIQNKLNRFFTLEVTDEKGRKKYLRFISKTNTWCSTGGGQGGTQ